MNILITESQYKLLLERHQEFDEIRINKNGSRNVSHLDKIDTIRNIKLRNKFSKLLWENKLNIQNFNDIAFDNYDNLIKIYLYDNNGKVIFFLMLTKEEYGYAVAGVASHIDVAGMGLGQKVYIKFVNEFQTPLFSDKLQTYSSKYGIWEKLYQKIPSKIGCVKGQSFYGVEMKDGELMCNGEPVYSYTDNDILLILYP